MEKQCLPQDKLLNYNALFSSYAENREKAVLQKVIKSSRRKAYRCTKKKFSYNDFLRKCNQICSFLIWSHLLKK